MENSANKNKKKTKHMNPEGQLRHALELCIREKNIEKAISLYHKSIQEGMKLNQYMYNALLYLFSSVATSEGAPEEQQGAHEKKMALEKGFEIYEGMKSLNIPPNEATLTAVARLALANGDGGLAFDMVKKMVDLNLSPRLRSYSPALMAFCDKGDADRAYEVDAYMAKMGITPEEEELGALLKVSCEVGREDKVYELLHRLRARSRQVSEGVASVIVEWFKGKGAGVGVGDLDLGVVREALLNKGGGWHGLGWLGNGDWNVQRGRIGCEGVCESCGERLACIDIEPTETEKFAKSLEELACSRETASGFRSFQGWLDHHGPYDFIVDGANIGLYKQNFAEGGFSFSQLSAIVDELQERSPSKKLPLIVMHNRRARGVPAEKPENKQLIERWRDAGALYTTPTGSNDDWYWLYAAVKLKCLLVTNDEMRDHLFALLGTDFFPIWKERHQVHFSFDARVPHLHFPPTFSIVIQESERGSWHIPIKGNDGVEEAKNWLCITRSLSRHKEEVNNVILKENMLDLNAEIPNNSNDCLTPDSLVVTDNAADQNGEIKMESLPSDTTIEFTNVTFMNGKRHISPSSPSIDCRHAYKIAKF